jgi:alkylation response protein AidB-like acyl-CoA dehydrogenase
MEFEIDPADDVFRCDVRTYIRDKMHELFAERFAPGYVPLPYSRDEMRRWTRAMSEKGLLVPHWPAEWGGTNWRPNWRRILGEELAAAQAPFLDGIGTDFVGPVLCAFGSPEQKRRFLPRICNGDHTWCQGFSEPDAGSDVMSLRTTAVRERDEYVINGRKLWTTNAHSADMMFALLRIQTPGVRKQQGLSFVLLDMRAPGVTVRPVIMIDGGHHVNEVLLENARTPLTNLIGEPGKGWAYARYLLTNERKAVAGLGWVRLLLDDARRTLENQQERGMPLLAKPAYRLQLAHLEVELQALEFMELRLLNTSTEDASNQALAPMLKLRATEMRQRITELVLQALGTRALECPADYYGPSAASAPSPASEYMKHVARTFLFQRSATLAGGTSETQRNVIAAVGFGL